MGASAIQGIVRSGQDQHIALLQGLFALAWAMWLGNPNEPVD